MTVLTCCHPSQRDKPESMISCAAFSLTAVGRMSEEQLEPEQRCPLTVSQLCLSEDISPGAYHQHQGVHPAEAAKFAADTNNEGKKMQRETWYFGWNLRFCFVILGALKLNPYKIIKYGQVGWLTPVIPVLRGLRQEGCPRGQGQQSNMVIPCLTKQTKTPESPPKSKIIELLTPCSLFCYIRIRDMFCLEIIPETVFMFYFHIENQLELFLPQKLNECW